MSIDTLAMVDEVFDKIITVVISTVVQNLCIFTVHLCTCEQIDIITIYHEVAIDGLLFGDSQNMQDLILAISRHSYCKCR